MEKVRQAQAEKEEQAKQEHEAQKTEIVKQLKTVAGLHDSIVKRGATNKKKMVEKAVLEAGNAEYMELANWKK